jgi:hypothetical protein
MVLEFFENIKEPDRKLRVLLRTPQDLKDFEITGMTSSLFLG